MMNLQQTEAERLYDQALSLYTCGQFAQAELLLDKAIAMEPSNALFQETRNSFHVTRWHSGYSHRPMPSHGYPNARPQPPQQFPMGSPRLHENGRLQGITTSTNQSAFQHAGYGGLWNPQHNGNIPRYTSSTVADAIPNHAQHRYSQGQIVNPYAARNSSGPMQRPVSCMSRTTTQDSMWGQWLDPTAAVNSAGETSWLDSGYKQTDVPWTEEPRKAASLPNNAGRNISCSASQSSLRGSTERFSLNERHNQGGRVSPQTWHSEGTCSESNYGLDNFEDVSNKVQEWLVKNDSTGVDNLPPHDPDYSTNKKMKKKKKKKTVASGKSDFLEKKFQAKDFQHVKTMDSVTKEKTSPTFGSENLARDASHVKSGQIQINTASYRKQDSSERTFSAMYGNNCQGAAPTKPHTNDSNSSKSCRVNNKPFFDPKRIFNSSHPTVGINPTCSETQEDSSDKIQFDKRNTTHCSKSNSALLNPEKGLTTSQNKSGMSQGSTQTQNFSQEKIAKEKVQQNRLDTSESTESDLSGRMTKEEWEEILARMYEPLGASSNHNSPEAVEGASRGGTSKTSEQKSPFHSSGYGSVQNSNTANSSPTYQSNRTANDFSIPEKNPKVGNTTAIQEEYINVKATVTDGVLRSSVPVCHAKASIVSSAPVFSPGKRFQGKDDSFTPVTAQRCSLSFETPVAVTSPAMKGLGHCSPSKPVLKAEAKIPAEPFVNLNQTSVAAGKLQTQSGDVCVETKSQQRSVQEARVKNPVTESSKSVPEQQGRFFTQPFINLDKTPPAAKNLQTKYDYVPVQTKSEGGSVHTFPLKNPATQPSKPFWQPSRIFAPTKSEETRIAGETKKTGGGATTKRQMPTAAKSLSTVPGEGQTEVSDAKSKSDKEGTMPQSSRKATRSSHVNSSFKPGHDEASSSIEATNSLSDATVGHTKTVPTTSNTKYSYVAWKEQNARKQSASVKKASSNKGGSKDLERSSEVALDIPKEAAPVQDPSVSTTNNITENSIASHSAKPMNPLTEKCTLMGSTGNKDSQHLKAASKTQEFSNVRQNPKDVPIQTWGSPSKEELSSSSVVSPEKCDGNKKGRPSFSGGGEKVKSASSTTSDGPQSHPNYAESTCNSWTTHLPASGRQSTDFGSKSARGGINEAHLGSHPTSDRSSSGEANAKSASGTTSDGPQTWPKYSESKTRTTYSSCSERQSTDFSSKSARGGTAEAHKGSHPTSDRPSSSGAKPASSTTSDGPQSWPKYSENEAQTTYPSYSARQSTNFSSNTARGGTTEAPRQRTSGSRSADAQTSGRSSTFRPRDDDFRSTPGSRRDTSEVRAASDVEDQPWYRWTKVIGQTLKWVVCFVLFLLLILLACLFSTIKVGAKYIWHILQELRNLIRESKQGHRSHGDGRGQRSKSSANHGPDSKFKATRSVDIPTSGEAAIKRLLQCDQGNPYEVLGVGSEASQDDIKKYYRRQCMLVHPDKNDLPHAREAFQILQKAYDTLSDPEKRREFEMESRHAHFGEEMEEFVKKMEEKMDEALNTLRCDVCAGKHRRYEVDRQWYSARYCSRHKVCHSASEGDVWVETTHLGFKWHYYAMMDDRIFDITEWAACQDMKYMEPNTCEVRYRVGTTRTRNTSRQRPPGFPNQHAHQRSHDHGNDMTEELLKEFLRRQFQQSESRKAPSDRTYGGGEDNRSNQEKGRRSKKHRKKKR